MPTNRHAAVATGVRPRYCHVTPRSPQNGPELIDLSSHNSVKANASNLPPLSAQAHAPGVQRSIFNPFTATGYFDIPPPRWPTFLAMLFHILKEGMGLSLLDELEVQYHVIKK